MNILDRIANWIGIETKNEQEDRANLEAALNNARRHRRGGKYSEAFAALDQAQQILNHHIDDSLDIAIDLHRADIYTAQGDWQKAEALLDTLQKAHGDRIKHLAYIRIAQGSLAQARDEWEKAQTLFDEAVNLARSAGSLAAEGRAQGHLADTYLHEGNASFGTYLLEEALTRLNASGDIEMSSYFVGRLGEAMVATGRRTDGQHLIGRALRMAEQMGYREFEHRWHRILAMHAIEDGLYQEAERHLKVILTATNTPADDLVVTLCQISKVALRLGEPHSAMDYARQAVEIARDADSALLAQAAVGIVLRYDGQFARSVEHLQSVVAGYSQHPLTQADYTVVDVLRNLAAAFTELARFDEAATAYEQAIAAASDSPLELAGTYRDQGIFHTRRGHYEDALRAWHQAIDIYAEANQHASVARLRCDIANLYKQIGSGKKAMKHYSEALMLLSAIDDPETRGVILANAATAYVDQGDIETAEAFFVESIQIAQNLRDRAAEVTRRGNYGWFLLSTGRPQRALETLILTVKESEQLNLGLQAAVQTDNIGLAYDELGQHEQALDFHRDALDRLEKLNFPHWVAVVKANIGHSLIAIDQLEAAADHFQQAEMHAGSTETHIRILIGKGRVALKQGDLNTVSDLTEQAIDVARRAGMRRLLADGLTLRSEVHAMSGNLDRAEADWKEAEALLAILRISRTPSYLGV